MVMKCDLRITGLMNWQGFIILLLRTTQILVLNFFALKGIASSEAFIYDS